MMIPSRLYCAWQLVVPVLPRFRGTGTAALVGCLIAGVVYAVSPAFAQADLDRNRSDDSNATSWTIEKPKTPFDNLANNLLKGLKNTAPNQSFFSNTKTQPGPKLAIAPFDADDIPVSPHFANALNDRLLASLQSGDGKRFQFMSHAEIGALMSELKEVSVFDDVADPLAALMQHQADLVKSAKPDILIMGTIRNDGTDILLSYKAAWLATGEIVASTAPQTVGKASKTNVAQLSLKQVVKKAADYFREHAADMTEVHLAGIRYKNTGGQPELGAYIQDSMSTALQTAFATVLTERKLIVKQAVLDTDQLNDVRKRGLGLEKDVPKPGKPETYDKRPGVYVLSGSYWKLNNAFEVRLSLKDARGRTVSYSHAVAASSMPQDLAIEPPPEVKDFAEVDGGSPLLRLSSDRGRNPVYHLGEEFNFVVELATDAWLYCFYLNAEGELYRIFPNKHQQDAALRGPKIYTVPSDRLFPFILRVREPLGMEVLKCFATKRNISDVLPAEVMLKKFAPLPGSVKSNVGTYVRRHAGNGVSEASLVVTVEK